MKIYSSIFPKTTNIDQKYNNLNTYQTGGWRESTGITASDIMMIGDEPQLHNEILDSEHRNEDIVRNISNSREENKSLFQNRSVSLVKGQQSPRQPPTTI